MNYSRYVLLIGMMVMAISLSAQPTLWKEVDASSIRLSEEPALRPKQFRALELDLAEMRAYLEQVPNEAEALRGTELSLPIPSGGFHRFEIVESSVMPAPLAAKFPLIQTFQGRSKEKEGVIIRVDVTYQGFHAMILDREEVIVIEPANRFTTLAYISYLHTDLPQPSLLEGDWCGLSHDPIVRDDQENHHSRTIGSHLLDFRLALAADSLYTAYHGGVSGAMSSMVTILNQVNALLERDFALRFTLIPNNDTLIFTGADPYTNGDVSIMFIENNIYLNQAIGSANFDVGHVFTRYTGGPAAGIAYLGSICGGLKGGGGTSGSPPAGVGFMGTAAHEMGHQLGAPHTFNGNIGGCNGNGSASNGFEPGSGTTIMSYPGLCQSHNTQSFRDLYFHNGSIEDVFLTVHDGPTCGDSILNNTQEPIVDAGTGGFFIPGNTPFELIGSGSDPDGDSLSFCWEQFDVGPAGHPDFPVGNAALFRSFTPVSIPTRIFPQISDIVNNTQTRGEILVGYNRDMTFRLTARDNLGGVTWEEIEFQLWGNAGPFLVTHPNTFTTWNTNTYELVTWDVANTDAPPISCQLVDITLSTDGGFTYPIVLQSQVPNSGSTVVQVPNVASQQCRIRVKANDNVFFDISNEDFQIVQPSAPGFSLFWPDTSSAGCVNGQTIYPLVSTNWLGFSDPISVSFSPPGQGITLTVNPNPFLPGDSAEIVVTTDQTAVPGSYTLALIASAGSASPISQVLELEISDDIPQTLVPQTPLNGSTGIAQGNSFSWQPIPNALTYTLEVATSPTFGSSTIIAVSGLTTPGYTTNMPLASQTPYYWRAWGENVCGAGPASPVNGFLTGICVDSASVDVPVQIPAFGTTIEAFSDLTVGISGAVSDVNVINLSGTHLAVQEITASLISPSGTEVVLFSGICNSFDQNFSLNFDDEAWQSAINCPPIDNGVYQAEGDLSDFVGEVAAGTWTLKIADTQNFNGGEIQSWGLELCVHGASTLQLINNQGLSTTQWQLDTLNTNLLEVNDGLSTTDQLIYTLVEKPQHGGLIFNSVSLEVGETFTQADIDQGKIAYLNNGSNEPNDAFRFDARNTAGAWIGIYTFDIQIKSGNTSIGDLSSLLSIDVYPNPARDHFQIRMNGDWTGNVELRVNNVQGQLILQQTTHKAQGETSEQIAVRNWAKGVYLIEIRIEEGAVWKKIMVH